MLKFKDRKGDNLNKKILKVEEVIRDDGGEITHLEVVESRADNVEEENEGTALNASELAEIITDMVVNVINMSDSEWLTYALELINLKQTKVRNNFLLPIRGVYGVQIEWNSSNNNVISIDGKNAIIESRSHLADEMVSLTPTVTKNDSSLVGDPIVITVLKYTDMEHILHILSSNNFPEEVSTDLNLIVSTDASVKIKWSTTTPNVIGIDEFNNKAIVNRGEEDENATLICTVSKGNYSQTHEYNFLVLAKEYTDEERVNIDKENLAISQEVTNSIVLPTSGEKESSIAWVSSNSNIIEIDPLTNNAVVHQNYNEQDVVLTATIRYGEESATKSFSVTVVALELSDLEKAQIDLNGISLPTSVDDDFTLPVVGSQYGYAITWSSNDSDISISSTGYATVYRRTHDVVVTLTASALNNQVTRSFTVVINSVQLSQTFTIDKMYYDFSYTSNSLQTATFTLTSSSPIRVEVTDYNSDYFRVTTSPRSTTVTITVEEIVRPEANYDIYSIDFEVYDANENNIGHDLLSISYY